MPVRLVGRRVGASVRARGLVTGRPTAANQSGSDEAISLRPRSRLETNPALNREHQTRGFGHVGIHTQHFLPPSLQAIPDRHAAAPLGLTPDHEQCVATVTVIYERTLRSKYGLNQIILGRYKNIIACALHQLFEDRSMFEFLIAVVALTSASIFFAHAVEAYLTQ